MPALTNAAPRVSEWPVPSASGALYRNVSWMLTGNVVYAGTQWALLVALAKLGSAQQVGELALGLAVTGPLFVASQLHLRGVQATDAHNQFSFSDYLGLRGIGTGIALLITIGLAVFFGYRMEIALIIIAVGLARSFDNISDIYYGALQQQECMARMAKSMMLKGAGGLAALAVTMAVTGSVLAAAGALALVSAITFYLYDRHSVRFVHEAAAATPEVSADGQSVRQGPLHWNARGYLELFKLAFPLTIVLVLVSLNLNMPRYFIEKYNGTTELGVFAALSYLVVAGNTVVNACGQASAPRLAKLYADGPMRRFWGLLGGLLAIGILCGVAGLLAIAIAGPQIVSLLYNPSYAKYGPLLEGLMLAAILLYTGQFLGYGMTAARIFRAQVPLFVAVTLATAAGCAVLIPRYGLQGAAAAMSLGFGVQVAGSAAILIRRWLSLKQ